jgi:hypothetical protein
VTSADQEYYDPVGEGGWFRVSWAEPEYMRIPATYPRRLGKPGKRYHKSTD